MNFCFENLLQIKQNSWDKIKDIQQTLNGISKKALLEELDEASIQYATEETVSVLPDTLFDSMKQCLGRDALGLTKLELITRFLNMTDAYLVNDMRYGIPTYMFNIPRRFYDARLYIDNIVFPLIAGNVTEYYWDDYEKFFFESQYIQVTTLLEKGKLKQFEICYNVTNRTVTARLENFEKVWKVLLAKSVRIAIDDSKHREFSLPVGDTGVMWPEKAETIMACTYWCDGLKQMKEIEDYYKIKFKLSPISDRDNVQKLYDAVNFVYEGIRSHANCTVCVPAEVCRNKIEIQEISLFEEGETIALPSLNIHNMKFVPYQTLLLPGTYSVAEANTSNVVEISCCCKYRAVTMGQSDLKVPA